MELTGEALDRVVREALAEDVGSGDVTSEGLVDPDAACEARILLKESGVACGLDAAAAVFRAVDPDVRFEALVADGELVESPPTPLARLEGRARSVLAAERTALNLVGRLCGIATLTRRYVDTVAGTRAVVLDTRKTTPGLRALEKHAVVCGGGRNHRFGLDDGILVKDNHLRLAGGIRAAVERLHATGTRLPIEVEAETLAEVREALDCGVEIVLLDNMPLETLAGAVALVDGRAKLEASGGITLDNVRAVAETGVDFISIGALTHSARSLDVSLEIL